MIYIINKNKTKIVPVETTMGIVRSGALWAIACGNEKIAYYLTEKEATNDMHKNLKKIERGYLIISFNGMELPDIDCSNCDNFIADKKGNKYCSLGKKIVKECSFLFKQPTIQSQETIVNEIESKEQKEEKSDDEI